MRRNLLWFLPILLLVALGRTPAALAGDPDIPQFIPGGANSESSTGDTPELRVEAERKPADEGAVRAIQSPRPVLMEKAMARLRIFLRLWLGR